MLHRIASTLLIAAAFTFALAAQTPTWKAELIGTPDPAWSTTAAVAVNDAGTAVGITYLSGYQRAWVAAPGQGMSLLPIPAGATFSRPYDLDSDGVVAGSVLLESGISRGVLWRPSPSGYVMELIPASPNGHEPFDARGINDRGDVVGKLGILGGSYYWNEAEGTVQMTWSVFPKVPAAINERRQIVADSVRMDLDTMLLEQLGNPTGTTYNYQWTELSHINDAGQCTGYAVTATSGWPYLPVRYSDGPQWNVFSNFPLNAAGAGGLSATGDTVFQLGIYGTYLWVDGVGSLGIQGLLDPAYAHFSVAGSFLPAISRGNRLACNGLDTSTGQGGIVLLTPLAFEDLGGAAAGALGDPVLTAYGSLLPGEPVRVRLASAAPGGVAIVALSATSSVVPLFGGTFHANPALVFLGVPVDGMGRFDMSADWPSVPAGTTVYMQVGMADAEAAHGFSLSNALEAVTR